MSKTTATTSAKPSKEEIEQRWPEAVEMARAYRAAFGDEVRLIWARNASGDELGNSKR